MVIIVSVISECFTLCDGDHGIGREIVLDLSEVGNLLAEYLQISPTRYKCSILNT